MPSYRSFFVSFVTFLIIFGTVIVKAVDECTSSTVGSTIVVDQSGKGNFKTVQAAVDSVPESNNQWIRILIKPGTYNEKVIIEQSKPCILLQGSKSQTSVIEWNDSTDIKTCGTFTVYANNIVAKNIVFKNTYNHQLEDTNDKKPAPAAVIYGDKCAFYSCSFLGLQDTLFDLFNRHYFKSCLIEGAVDFIFGLGQSLYEDCKISIIASEALHQQSNDNIGYITAHKRNNSEDNTGFVFKGGKVYGNGQAYLGRAWGPYARVIFYGTEFSDVVYPLGWDFWQYGDHKWDLTYVESKCTGTGSDKSGRVKWGKSLSVSEVNWFTSLSFIDEEGWINKQPIH